MTTAAIAGIGATEFSKDSGRSELRLAAEAVRAALADAALSPADVDGLVTFTMDSNAEIAVARELGIPELSFFSQIGYGGGAACATVQHAAMAVATGAASVVVCYRALNERSGRRFGQVAAGAVAAPTTPASTTAGTTRWASPRPRRPSPCSPAATCMSPARPARTSAGSRSRTAATPRPTRTPGSTSARSRSPSTRRPAGSPSRSGCSTAARRATAPWPSSSPAWTAPATRPHRPAVIAAAAQGAGPDQYTMTSYYRDDLAGLPEMGVVAGQLWRQAGIGPADVRTAVLYDHFTPYVLIQLEELGFCGRGEARDFIADGAIELGGRLPVNPHGGQLGEAYIHGMNGIAEAVRQVRGTSVNQVPGDGPVLVTAGTGVPTSGLILS